LSQAADRNIFNEQDVTSRADRLEWREQLDGAVDRLLVLAIHVHVRAQSPPDQRVFPRFDHVSRLFGRSVYVKRSSSMHLVLHLVQVVSWFPVSLMCLSDNCSSTYASVPLSWQITFLLVKSACKGPYVVVVCKLWPHCC